MNIATPRTKIVKAIIGEIKLKALKAAPVTI